MSNEIEFTKEQKEMIDEVGEILKEFDKIEGISVELKIGEGRATYQVFENNNLIITGSGDNLLDLALKAEEAIINYFNQEN